MKKIVKTLLALALCLTLTLCAAAPALAVEVTVVSDGAAPAESVAGLAVIGDTLYYAVEAVGGTNFYTRAPGDPAVALLGKVEKNAAPEGFLVNALFQWNDKLYALNIEDGLFFSVLDEAGAVAPVLQQPVLDTSALVEKDGDSVFLASLTSLFAMGDHLYYASQSYNQGFAVAAGRISLLTGENQTFATPSIMALAPYENGKLIAYVYDASALYGSDSAAMQDALQKAGDCAVFDPEKDATESAYPIVTDNVLGGMSISGFCYGNGTVYFGSGSRITGLDIQTGETRVSGYTGEGLYGALNSNMVAYAGGYYVAYGYSGLTVYQLDGENLQKGVLRIFGEMGTDAHKSFTKNYPDIPVEVAGEYSSSLEDLTQAMVTENDPYDVLLLSLNYMPVDRLLKKGYCADLSANTELWDIVNQMYPEYGQILQQDGKLYGVPVDVTAYTFGVNMELWKELGLSEDDLPGSYPEMLDFAANWVYDYADDYPDIALFNYGQSSTMIFSLMLSDYLAYTQWKGQDTLFNTPVYRQLLKSFEAVDFTEIDSLLDKDAMYLSSDKALFSVYAVVVPMNYQDKLVTPLYLSMDEEEDPFLAAQVTVMIVNPKTTRMDDALLYVNNYLRNLSKEGANVTLFPDHNEPVESSYYQKNLDALNTALASANQRLETAGEENKANVREEISGLEANLAELETERYSVTPEKIEDYRNNIFPKLFIQRQNLLYSADNKALTEINTLMMQYLEGALDADRMITELDNRLKLMAMEDH